MGLSLQLERVGMAGMFRGFVAGILGCLLWVGVMLVYVAATRSTEGEEPSFIVTLLVVLISGTVTAAPCVLSQMTRGRWTLEDYGLQERITPLVSFLPFGLTRERVIRWQDIESFGVNEMRLRGGRVLHYFRVHIPGRPRIEIARKEKEEDPQFDEFVAEFSRRMTK